MFRGVFEHQIDAKGRTTFPARLRETLVGAYDERLILTTALDPCLHAYPLREWESLEAALAKRNPMEPGVKTLMRLYVAQAQGMHHRQARPTAGAARSARPRRAPERRRLGRHGQGDSSSGANKAGPRLSKTPAPGADSAEVMRVLGELRSQ